MSLEEPTVRLWCSTCRGERPFSVVDCPDGHGGDCPERACADCGEAVVRSLTRVA